jgi:hypothetical protein
VLPFSVPKNLQSKNEVIQFVNRKHYWVYKNYPAANEIIEAAIKMNVVKKRQSFPL